jgi:Cu2+-exporting ATPase
MAASTPKDKLARVPRPRRRATVVMVGDGINDAPVLARADVSLAMGQGALVARTQADAVIVSNRLADLVRARAWRRSARCASCVRTLPGPRSTTRLHPAGPGGLAAALGRRPGHGLSSLVVVLNALRACALKARDIRWTSCSC